MENTTSIKWGFCIDCGRPFLIRNIFEDNELCEQCEKICKDRRDTAIRERANMNGKKMVQVDSKTWIVIPEDRSEKVAVRNFKHRLKNYNNFIINE